MAHGRSPAGKSSSLFIPETGEVTAVALLLIGAVAAILHAKLRLGIGLPGHHGLEWMTALLFARCASGRDWAALIVGLGAAGAAVALAAADPAHLAKAVPVYLLSAGLVDLVYRATPGRLRGILAAALIGALVYGAKPVLQLGAAALADATFGFMRHGNVFPVVTHAAFGLIGGACGALLARGLRTARRRGPGSGPAD
jgi:hypothetical protein